MGEFFLHPFYPFSRLIIMHQDEKIWLISFVVIKLLYIFSLELSFSISNLFLSSNVTINKYYSALLL